jgi:hypothetical protein
VTLFGDIPYPAAAETAHAGFFSLDDNELEQVWAMAKRHANDLGRSEIGDRLFDAMYAACPVHNQVSKFLSVLLRPGQEIAPHKHRRHAMLWYPDGAIRYIAPGTVHGVLRVTVQRLSVAMLVDLCDIGGG